MAKRKAARAAKKTPARRSRKPAGRKAAAKQTAARKSAARKTTKARARKAGAKNASAKKAGAKNASTVKKTAPARRTKAASPAPKKVVVAKKVAKKKAGAKTKAVKRALKKPVTPAARPARSAARTVAVSRKAAPKKTAPTPVRKAPALNRQRRILDEDIVLESPPSSLDMNRSASAVRSGRKELREKYAEHTETSPALTAGDVDADWESAYAVGDEAPGGDNPTPDQDIVDDIGRAVGIEYQDNEELKGADKVEKRDKNRWELDPASSDDWDDRD